MKGRALLPFTGVLGAAVACSSFEPQGGAVQEAYCVDADSDPSTNVDFHKDIRPLMDWTLTNPYGPGCSECHYPTGDILEGITEGELDLSTLGSLRKGGVTSGRSIVIAGKPCESAIVRKLLGIYAPAPTRMPRSAPRYWTTAEIKLVEDWIAEGAVGADDE
jgi:hypothetical protein